jgi:membrane protein required for colicin V production
MPITWLDLLVLTIMLVSGVLAMIRGFFREVLSVAAWAAAAAVTVMFYDKLLPIAEANLGTGTSAKVAVILGTFLVTLLIGTIIVARISNMVLDSRIGALDRTLGMVFGLARGLLIMVVAFFLFTWFVPADKLPEGVRDAKSRETLQVTGKWLQSLLPQDMDNYISSLVGNVLNKRQPGKPSDRDQDSPDSPPRRGGSLVPASPRNEQLGYNRSDRREMRQLIESMSR